MPIFKYFAGANTAEGFVSRFEDVLPKKDRRRMFYIKGGPGVGKSSLMKRVAEHAEAAGLDTERFYCSSDPQSLDALAIPSRGFAIMDGTAPHVYDPVAPAARDTLLSLGDYLDEKRMRPHAKEIDALMRDISARFARCYEYLGAARHIRAAASLGCENSARVLRLAYGWRDALPKRGGEGKIRRLFGSAVTLNGVVDLLDESAYPHIYGVDCPQGHDASRLIELIADFAAAQGLDAIILLDPLCPDKAVRAVLPEHGICFRAEPRGGKPGEWLPAEGVLDLCERSEKEQSYDQNAYELLLLRAVEQLRAAKALHDELETFYKGAMDFALWDDVLKRVIDDAEL